MKIRTAVDADLRAFHTDPTNDPAINEGRHEHVWNIQLVFEQEIPDGAPFEDAPIPDGRPLRAALLHVIAMYEGRDLPWWSGESIARGFLCIGTGDPIGCIVTEDPIGCIVTRPGYRAEVWL